MFDFWTKSFVYAFEAYALLGFLFAAIFVSFGLQRLDSEARGSGIAFRLLILPGVAAFWPMLLRRWVRGMNEPPLERTPHRTQK
jgi:hypothetical protein